MVYELLMLSKILEWFRPKNDGFTNVAGLSQVKIVPRPQLNKLREVGQQGHMIEGNVIFVLADNMISLRDVCEDIVKYREEKDKRALDEAIQQLKHMLFSPDVYMGYTEHMNEQ